MSERDIDRPATAGVDAFWQHARTAVPARHARARALDAALRAVRAEAELIDDAGARAAVHAEGARPGDPAQLGLKSATEPREDMGPRPEARRERPPPCNDLDVPLPHPGARETRVASGANARTVRPWPVRRSFVIGAGALALAASAMLFVRSSLRDRRGDITADGRTEIAIGGRAHAVLEPSAHVVWRASDDVEQAAGSVFYRVDPGKFVVHTAAGDVRVLGTCFRVDVTEPGSSGQDGGGMNARDVKAAATGAAIAAMVLVVVYEGKVAVSRASATVTIGAGESATLDRDGVHKLAAGGEEDAPHDGVSAANGDPLATANTNLVRSMSEYRERLERMDNERRALTQELADTRARLEAVDGGAKATKTEITEDEWKELAKTGTIRMRVPCNWKGGWSPPAKKLEALGLAPSDGPILQAASNRIYESSWSVIKPICEKVGGKDIAEKLGLDGCPNFVFNYLRGADREPAWEAMRRVGEIRAGLLPMPSLDDPSLGPIEKVFLVMTGQQKAIEQDLAQSFGPDEAHRIVTAEAFCAWTSTWNGAGPRKGTKP